VDVAWLRDVQSDGQWLELEDQVLVSRAPMSWALGTLWPLERHECAVVVERPAPSARHALCLARRRSMPCEADLQFVTPALDKANGASLVWARVVADACHWLAAHGAQRVYAAVADDNLLALQVLRQVGFVVYTADVVLHLAPESVGLPVDGDPPTPLHAESPDPAAAQALCAMAESGLPTAVRPHLPAPGADWESYPMGGQPCEGMLAAACLDERGAVVGGWRAVAGRAGSWLRVEAGPDASAGQVVASALAVLAAHRRFRGRPLYASARGYEPEIDIAYREAGFEAVAGRFRLVRHATARVLSPAWSDRAHREAVLEPKATSVQSQSSRHPSVAGGRP
jgi:hypothetical protein